MSYVLGIDLGTGSLKGLVFNETGALIDVESKSYSLYTPKIGYSEQNPIDWKEAMFSVIKRLIEKIPKLQDELVAIGFSGQMHSLVLLDKDNQVIRPAILWNDVRTSEECLMIMKKYGERLKDISKNIALEGFTLPKILWVMQNEPENWNKVSHVMLPKDYLVHVLTGKYSMDYSDAAGTLLLDVEKLNWSKETLTMFNIPRNVLPELFQSSDVVGNMTSRWSNEFGFKQPIKIIAGGADNACAALGAGIIHDDFGMVSIGTSGVFLMCESDRTMNYDGELHLFNHSVPDLLYSMGVTLAAGNSLEWFKNTFVPDKEFDDILSEINQIPIGCEGLIFTPYISGERTPHNDSQIRGSFTGIDIRHGLNHFTRSVLEGITYSLKDSQMIMQNIGNKKLRKLISVGGGAKSSTWLQMQADIFNAEIVTLQTEQGPGVGAAMLAAVGCGLVNDFRECVEKFVNYGKSYMPNAEDVLLYNKEYKKFQKVYPNLKKINN